MSINAKPWESAGGAATVPDASETTKGKIRIATSTEAATGTDDLTAMTPFTVKERIDAALVGGVEYKGSYTGQSLVTAEQGDMYISAATYSLAGVSLLSGDHIIFNQDAADPVTSAMFDKIDNTDAVSSVNTLTGAVVLSGDDIAADHSASNYTPANANIDGHLSGIDDELLLKAPLASPSLTGTPTAPTATQGDNSTKLATTAYVDTAVSGAGGNQITDISSQNGSSFTATANEIYICGYSTGTQTITFPDASSSTDGDLIGLSSVTTTEFTVDLVSSDGTTNDLLNMSNQTKGGTNGAITLTLKQELILFACDGTRWRQLSRELADVAKTGAYADLSGTPTLATVATTGAYSDLSGTPTLGTAAALDVGTGANNVVQLDGSSRLPAVDGSQLTNLPSGVTDLNGLSDVTITSAAEGNLLQNNASGQFVNVAKSTIDVGDFNDDSTYQLRDAGLTSIAGLTTSADKMIYTTGSDAYDVTSLTAAGRAILDDADATAQRSTLGLGSAATEDVGTGANNVVQLDGSSRLPAVDGSQLTNLPSGASDLDGLSDVTITTPTSSGQILRNNGSGQFVNVALSIVDDTTPQLGGALDVNGNAITSASNGNVTINPDGTGDISVGADIIPDADATHTIGDEDNRFISLYSDVNGAIRFKAKNDQGSSITKGQVVYIKGISGDVPTVGLARANSASTMPGFGLALTNANDQAEVQIITFGNLTAYNTTTYSLSAGDTVYVSAATAGALTNSAPASETNLIQNIGKVIRASATEGIIKVGGAGRSAATPNLNDGKIFLGNGSNQAVSTALSSINLSSFNDDLSSTYQPLDAGLTSISGLTTAANKMIYTTASDTYAVADLTSAGRAILDDADAAAQRTTLGLVIGTDVLANVVEDTTPQLGGNLDLNGQDIVTTSNADLDLAPDGTGVVAARGNTTGGNNTGAFKLYCQNNSHWVGFKSPVHADYGTSIIWELPAGDGSANQVLETDGNGVLSWVDQSGGGGGTSYTYDAITAGTTTAQAWYHYSVDTSGGAVTINLPALSGLTDGDEIRIKLRDATNSVTIDANASENIDGGLTYTLDVAYQAVTLVAGSTEWEII